MPTEPCNVHGEPRARLVRDVPTPEFPRAQLAVDLSEVKPVIIKGPTLLADKDPYNSAKSIAKVDVTEEKEPAQKEATLKIDNPTSEDGKPILRAIPVEPEREEPKQEQTPVEIRRADTGRPDGRSRRGYAFEISDAASGRFRRIRMASEDADEFSAERSQSWRTRPRTIF